MIRIKRIKEPENCAACGRVHKRTFLLQIVWLEMILCKDCLTELQYECHPHTRWP